MPGSARPQSRIKAAPKYSMDREEIIRSADLRRTRSIDPHQVKNVPAGYNEKKVEE